MVRPPSDAATRREFVVTALPHLAMDVTMTVMLAAALTAPGAGSFAAASGSATALVAAR
ncbi:hypothetical protein ACRS6B_16490 [Nocardia asteroides]